MKIRKEQQMIAFREVGSTGAANSSLNMVAPFPDSYFTGTVTRYLEITVSQSGNSSGSVRLRRLGTTTDDLVIARSTFPADGTPGFYRSTALTLDGASSYFLYADAVAGESTTFESAQLVIIQDVGSADLMNTCTEIELGGWVNTSQANVVFSLPGEYYFHYDSADWNGTLTVSLRSVLLSPITKSPATVKLQVSDATDSFSGWTDVTGMTVSAYYTYYTAQFTTYTANPFISGRNYRVVASSPTTKGSMTAVSAELCIKQAGAVGTPITKTLGLHTFLGGAASSYATYGISKWEPADWSGVDNVYKHQASATAANTCVVDVTGGGSSITGSSITNPGVGLTTSSAMTMPGTACNIVHHTVSGTNGVVQARLLIYTTRQTSTSAIKTINGLARSSIKTINGLAIASVKNRNGLV